MRVCSRDIMFRVHLLHPDVLIMGQKFRAYLLHPNNSSSCYGDACT